MDMNKLLKVETQNLQTGMYISALDRPWLETPFLIQGFYVKDTGDIQIISDICQYVFVDTSISTRIITSNMSTVSSAIDSSDVSKSLFTDGDASHKTRPGEDVTQPRAGLGGSQLLFPDKKLEKYEDVTNWKSEGPAAEEAVNVLHNGLNSLLSRNKNGGPLEIQKVKEAVDPMINSVIRNPDACIWLARMKQQDQYIYQHSLGTSIWAVALGRQIGLPKSDLRSLAIGGLLFDIGKLQLDKAMLQANRRLTSKETREMKKHVEVGVRLLKEGGMTNPDILDMVSHHHERYNGTGYPQGLLKDEIPVFGRIAAIVDCYDAITSDRIYASAIPPTQAIKQLYNWKDVYFQAEIIEQFIQAIGIYPAGTVVELTSGEIAIVVAASRTRRLRPEIMLLLDSNKKPLSEMEFIDMKEVTHSRAGMPLDIINSVEPNAYGIDLSAIML
ncbi:MAG: HD-GYP domain-containing protein [Gammaproteobacteria bacterium]|nr:HD-GYP domain-containing protein [Gammaproteobacteria bacterium]